MLIRSSATVPAVPRARLIEEFLDGMPRFQQRMCSQLITDALREYRRWHRTLVLEEAHLLRQVPRIARKRWIQESESRFCRRDPELAPLRMLTTFCDHYSRQLIDELNDLHHQQAEFRQRYSSAATDAERTSVILSAAATIGRRPFQLFGDRRATKRWMSEDAIHDRFARRIGKAELQLTFVLDRYGRLVRRVMAVAKEGSSDPVAAWKRIALDNVFQRIIRLDADPRLYTAAVRAIRVAATGLPSSDDSLLEESSLAWLGRAATSENLDAWLQAEALELLHAVAPKSFDSVAQWRLKRPSAGDDIFVRRRAVRLLLESTPTEQLPAIFEIIRDDPSVFVRQQFAASLWKLPPSVCDPEIEILLGDDLSLQVRAATLAAIPETANRPELRDTVRDRIVQVLDEERDEFVLRTAMHVATEWVALQGHGCATEFATAVIPRLRKLIVWSDSVPLRRWATAALERIAIASDERLSGLTHILRKAVKNIPLGKSRTFSRRRLKGYSDNEIGRVLAELAQDDFGLDLDRGIVFDRITRGPVFALRLWRVWFEFRHAATDKRQAFRHTIGRIGQGTLRAPSRIMAELSPTKVPGEPLHIANEGTWRPYLPLVDDFVSVLNQSHLRSRPFKFFTGEGTTTVIAPRNPVRRIKAALTLTHRFADIAKLRNWTSSSAGEPGDYLAAIRELGFRIEFQSHRPLESSSDAHSQPLEDESVLKFFGIASLFLTPKRQEEIKSLLYDYAIYFGSSFENSLAQLLLFAAIVLAIFLARHFYSNLTLALARRRIPISIGGWGTRGKSGTERLKAALLGGIGHSLVSKTTGCEAMFIHADAFGDPLEIPLFRPYDKATIWEQRNLLLMTGKMRPSAFLWECMGLTPSYVDVLQRQWTCDDIGTITNTYPDHEDLQGPAGYDVATTISGFAPRNSHVITTEQQMRPMVQESCNQVRTSLQGIGWLESGLVANDILDRFPYAEHPDNIALVAAMAAQLGCEYDYAVKVMADYLVADLGVLKTYPVAKIDARELEFTNGMSANERFGCLGNWKRTGFETQDPHRDRDVWLSTVVNNRADRVARSRVFAQILVEDISADRHFLIGNNLQGLIGFIEEAWEARASKFTLCDDDTLDPAVAIDVLQQAAKEFRQPTSDEHIANLLRLMIEAILPEHSPFDMTPMESFVRQPDTMLNELRRLKISDQHANAIQMHHQEQLTALEEFESLRSMIEDSSTEGPALDHAYRETAKRWFDRKLVIVDNYSATGEQIIRRVIDATPPGIRNRVMGIQNIKGTGLDFIYRFQAWASCHEACQLMRSNDIREVQKGLQTLSLMPQFGQLCQTELRQAIDDLESSPNGARPDIDPILATVKARCDESRSELEELFQEQNQPDDEKKGLLGHSNWLINAVEQYFEINDAVRRRNIADQVYSDLAAERISRQQAVEQIRKINKRQKGGWLSEKLVKTFSA